MITSTGAVATVQIVLHDQTGAPVAGGATQLRVPANGQVVRAFDDLFPNVKIAAFQGVVVATSDQGVFTTVARGGPGVSVNVPVLPTR